MFKNKWSPVVARFRGRVERELQTAGWAMRRPQLMNELQCRAVADSAEFIEANVSLASLFTTRSALHEWIVDFIYPDLPRGLFLEFGVFEGESARRLSRGVRGRGSNNRYYCFDAFLGLRDSWSQVNLGVGAFNLGGVPPKLALDCEPVVGWVEDTLEPFLAHHTDPISSCHFDMDVYPPTRLALNLVRQRLISGSAILFDEHHGYPGWRNGEFRALNELLERSDFEYLALDEQAALIRIK